MEMYVMHDETVICSSRNMTVLPRKGEKLLVNGDIFKVKDIAWNLKVGAKPFVVIIV